MTREEESWQKQLQRNRDEMRRLENMRFWASILFAVAALAMAGALLFWASQQTELLSMLIEGAVQ